MGSRRKSREYAMQVLFQVDITKQDPKVVLENFWIQNESDDQLKEFTEKLVLGVCSSFSEVDKLIVDNSTNWKLTRMAVVDRNVLRLAVYELLHCSDIPKKVTLNESIEIAKRFGSEDSGSFVNGVIDKIAKAVDKK